MDLALALARFLLAVTFAVAGVAKLADFAGSRKSMIDFGVPKALAGPFGILLPVVELIAAIALLPGATAWWGAAAALALLLLFIAGISYNLALGRRPDCHCFGQIHSAPAGWMTLTRNLVLCGIAGLVLWPGPGNPQGELWSALAAFGGAQIALLSGGLVLLVGLAANLWLMVQLVRQNGRLLLRIDAIEEKLGMGAAPAPPVGLPPASPAPEFTLTDVEGGMHSLQALRSAGKPVVLIFIEPGCGPCDELLPEVAGWQKSLVDKLTVTVVSRGGREANRDKKAKHQLTDILLQKDGEVANAYQCAGTPGAVMVNADGTVGSHLAMGAEEIQSLVRHATMPPAAKKGDPAPQIRLPDLNGKSVDLEQFHGSRTIILFWNPGCGFCREVLEDIRAWERKASGDTLRLLVVSAGSAEDNRAQGFRSPVVVDQGFSTGSAFGVGGTPSAVLVDENGKVASKVAVGAQEVMALVKGARVD